MTYSRPEVRVIGAANLEIQGTKPVIGFDNATRTESLLEPPFEMED